MARRSRIAHASRKRSLRVENLQRRELLAADCGVQLEVAAIEASNVALNSDAGSTRATALDLGVVTDQATARGKVGFADRLDLFRFEVGRDGTAEIDLTGLRRNADLLIADESGSVLETSRRRGRASESISVELAAGAYYVGVQSRSFFGSNYRLSLEVDLNEPVVDPPEDPTETIAPINSPAPEQPSSANPSTPTPTPTPVSSPSSPSGSVSPLADVAYFGGVNEWNINSVNAPEAWAAGYTGEGVTVAVIDTGVDLDHPDLVESLYVNAGEIAGNGIDDDGNGFVDDVHGYDFAGRDSNPNDSNGHGTHVAGSIAAGLNGFGANGVAPDAKILPVRVLGDSGSGSSNAVAAGIRYAADQGADIINLSLGGGYSQTIQSAINYAQNLGSFIVAAAGNEASAVPGFPARFSSMYDNVISVGAHDRGSSIAGFSNDVGNSGSVQIDAPGVGVFSTYSAGRVGNLSGTSMAAPQVAGVAALALSANPDLTPSQLRSLLVGGVTTVAAGSDATGIVNAATTVAYAAAGLTSAPTGAALAAQNVGGRGNARVFRTISLGPIAAQSDFLMTSDSTAVDSRASDAVGVVYFAQQQKHADFTASEQAITGSESIDIVFSQAASDTEQSEDLTELGPADLIV